MKLVSTKWKNLKRIKVLTKIGISVAATKCIIPICITFCRMGGIFTKPALCQPLIEVVPDSIHVSLYIGSSTSEKLTISNNGGSNLNFKIAVLPNLSPSPERDMDEASGIDSAIMTQSNSNSISTTESSPSPPIPVLTSLQLVPADFLVIDHGKYKAFLNAYSHVLISEADLNSLNADDLNQYEVLYCEPDWFSYVHLSNSMSTIEEYAWSGGIAVINIVGNIGDGLGICPLGTNYANYDGEYGGLIHNFEYISDSAHAYITGQPFGGHQLTEDDFLWWFSTDGGHLFDYPENTSVVLNNFPNASWIEYKLGRGRVIVTTLTYGWGLGGARGAPLENLIRYSIHLAKTNWVSFSLTSGSIPPGESHDLDLFINASELDGGDYSAVLSIQSNDSTSAIIEIPVSLHVSEYPCGDANGDLSVDARDSEYLMQTYFFCGPPPISLRSSDFNCNNLLDFSDVLVLDRFLSGVETLECCTDSLVNSQLPNQNSSLPMKHKK